MVELLPSKQAVARSNRVPRSSKRFLTSTAADAGMAGRERWALAHSTSAELVIVEDAGHSTNPTITQALIRATDQCAVPPDTKWT